MTALVRALLAELTEEDLAILAERLRPFLAPENGSEWITGASAIAAYLDVPRSRIYTLSSAGRIPVEHDGSLLCARRSELDRWRSEGGGKCP